MKKIILFGAGKSATSLIEYLCTACEENNWKLLLCDTDLALAQSKIVNCNNAIAIAEDVSHDTKRRDLIQSADIVISMLPPHLHFLVANDCLNFSKHLLTAFYIFINIRSR